VSSQAVHSPAKINLFLAVTGRRADGYHDLISLVAPLELGDTLSFEPNLARRGFSLECGMPGLPVDESNLVLRAAKAFVSSTGWTGSGVFRLDKHIPVGAGLGGGSSNASAALRLLNQVAGTPLSHSELVDLAAGLGADCPLFLAGGPVIMRGKGERLSPLSETVAKRLAGRRVLVFKPSFGISTPWAYSRLAAGAPASYLPEKEAERSLEAWLSNERLPLESLLFNNMQGPAFAKYVALPTLLERLRKVYSLVPLMSGSGSACFCLLQEGYDAMPLIEEIEKSWGTAAFSAETRIA
jgi:4-diphosphocytidyl-2-C-methyl-D-erythritol kinase